MENKKEIHSGMTELKITIYIFPNIPCKSILVYQAEDKAVSHFAKILF